MSIRDLVEGSDPNDAARVGVAIARSVVARGTASADVVAVAQQLIELGEAELAAELRRAPGDTSGHLLDTIVGPFYDAAGAAVRVGVTVEAVQLLARQNVLLGCPTAEGEVVFPTFQFGGDGTAVPGFSDVLAALFEGTRDPWQIALWMSTPTDELLGQAPRDAIGVGPIKAVLLLAVRTAARWRQH